MSHAEQFLNAELAHAAAQLARVRRIAAALEHQLAAQGFSEVEVYEELALSKAYRQLERDEVVFHQMWLRTHRHLLRLPHQSADPAATARPDPGVSRGAPTTNAHNNIEQTRQDLEREIHQHKPQPYRKPPTPSPNQPCSCGSNIKFKKCCGNPLRQMARAA